MEHVRVITNDFPQPTRTPYYEVDDHLEIRTNLIRSQMGSTAQYLFACGDFQQAAVQERVFGRRLAGKPDALVGFCREPFVRPSGILHDRVDGMVLEVTDADLAVADACEPPNYRRSKIRTASGLLAWVYLRQN